MASFIKVALDEAVKELTTVNKARKKAARRAVQMEAYRLFRLMQKEVMKGAPGGKQFAPLKQISKSFTRTPNRPLYELRHAIRYDSGRYEDDDGTQMYAIAIGAVATRRENMSLSWARIMEKQQAGFTMSVPIYPPLRTWLQVIGSQIRAGKSKFPKKAAKFYFLRAETTEFTVPPRDIVDSFWAAHQSEALPNIVSNYERKLKNPNERI